MDVNSRNRAELKSYFVKNSIPTESNFAELIDAMLNQKDDGIVKLSGSPLSVEAAGDDASEKRALNIYQSLNDQKPDWTLNLNPRSNPNNPGTARSGFNISDGEGNNRLFIDRNTGNVGIGTIEPTQAKLEINGSFKATSNVSGQGEILMEAPSDGKHRIDPAENVEGTYKTGLVYRVKQNPAAGAPIFQVRSSGQAVRLFVDHDGWTGSRSNSAWFEGSKDNYFAGKLGLGTTSPTAKLDVMAANRTGSHPSSVNGLYVTGNFGADSGGVEFRHTNATQGIGFGYNTIYATGTNANQDLGLKARGTGKVNVTGTLQADKYIVQDSVNGGMTKGIWMWNANDSNWGIYMGQAGAERSLTGGNAVGGAGFNSHAIRFRTYSHQSNGLIYENSNEQLNLSVRASDGQTYIRGNVGIGTDSPGDKLDVFDPTTSGGGGMTIRRGRYARLSIISDNYWSGIELRRDSAGEDGRPHIDFTNDLTTNYGIRISAPSNDALTIEGGNVGIDTTSPTQAKLVVNGHVNTQVKGYGYLNRNGANATNNTYTSAYSIWCSQRVAASEFNATSDRRVKNIIGLSDPSQDLETLTKLQITDYTFIDVVNNGPGSNKKLIGQQVQRVYPMAVNVTEDYIPNIYEMSTSTRHDSERGHLVITMEKMHGLVVGDTVRIIDDGGSQELEVLSVQDGHSFTVASDRAAENMFVYGKRVDDFLVLDYEAIAMLNVSATQELAKRVDDQHSRIVKLESENALLKATMAAFKTGNTETKRKIDQYEPAS